MATNGGTVSNDSSSDVATVAETSSIRCTVCDITLGPQSSTTSEEEESLVPFVALACQGGCQTNTTTKGKAYYCVPGCWEHFLKYQWGLYSGLGQAHQLFSRGLLGQACAECRADLAVVSDEKGSLSMEESLLLVSPEVLAKALAIFQSATLEKLEQQTKSNGKENGSKLKAAEEEEDPEKAIVRRLTQQLEEARILKCPSCQFNIGIPEDRGCDAAWCEHCGRALCLYCLMDCGDHPKTDPTATGSRLIGDAHDHVLNNDCGWTAGKGIVHSGKTLHRHHEQQFLQKVALRLKRVPEPICIQVCRNLMISPETLEEATAVEASSTKRRSNLTEFLREMDNEKWEAWSNELRANFLHAAYKGDVPTVQCILDCGIPCNIPDAVGGETALHFAACKGHVHVVKLLLQHGANPWQLSPPGRTPLDDLCNMDSACDLETTRCLIRACMLRVPANQSKNNQKEVCHPWLRPWPNGTTAESNAQKHHPDSPVYDYFKALQEYSYKLCKACASGETEEAEQLLSNHSNDFPRPEADITHLPPAIDLIWVYNRGSGCTPLLDLCAKVQKGLQPKHVLATARRILEVAKDLDDNNYTVQKLLHMRDVKFHGTALHWLALDPRQPILKVAGLFLQHAGSDLSRAVDKRGQTPLDWARKYALNKEGEEDSSENSEERQKHIQRWEGIILAWDDDI